MPRTVEIPVDLTDARATAGRHVSVNVPVRYPEDATPAELASAASRARQRLQELVQEARTQVDPFPDQGGADLTVTGALRGPWTSVWLLRRKAYDVVQEAGLQYGVEYFGFGPEDVAVLDLDAEPVERDVYGPREGFFDPTGEINPDGTLNARAVVENGAEEGLRNVGRGFGSGLKVLGAGIGGVFSGLGTGGTVVVLLLLVAVALAVLAYVFGPAFFLGALRGGA